MAPYFIFIIFTLGLLRLLLWQLIVHRLRMKHKNIYTSMDKPNALGLFQRTNTQRIRKFLYKLEFRKIGDRSLSTLAWIAISIELLVLYTFAIVFLYFSLFR